MITMKHVPSGRTIELSDSEAVKQRILERCGWSPVVGLAEEPIESLANTTTNGDDVGDIPEDEEQPNDGPSRLPAPTTPKRSKKAKP